MRVRTAVTRAAARRPALAVVGWAIVTVLVAATVSACTSSPPSTSVYLPTASGTVTTSDGATSTTTVTTHPSTPAPAIVPASPTMTVTVTVTPAFTPAISVPPAAPDTGGGGTAGLQDGVLFMIGGVAIAFGAGSFFYRRRLTKDR